MGIIRVSVIRMRRHFFVFAIMVLLCGISSDADAQFFKKLFGRKHKDKIEERTTTRRQPIKEKPVVQPRKRIEPVYPASVLKDRYRIDVFVSLYLDELVKDDRTTLKGKVPEKAVNGLDFYEGVKLASDTLNALGYAIDVYVHDVIKPAETPVALIASKTLDSTDLIIGALSNAYIPALADFCKTKHINFISAQSPSDAGVRNNPYFIMMQPSLAANCEWIMAAVNKKHKTDKPLILYRKNVTVDSNALNYLKIQNAIVNTLSCNVMPSREVFKSYFDSARLNVLIVPILDVTYAETILTQLHNYFPGYNFEVYGMPTWKNMNALKKPDAFANIAVNVPLPYYFDFSKPNAILLSARYKNDLGSGRPAEMVFRGYETMYWYAYMLSKYGTIFNTHFEDNSATQFTRYEIKAKYDKDDKFMYHENKRISLIRYRSSSYTIEE